MKQVFPLRIRLKLRRKPWRPERKRSILADCNEFKAKLRLEHKQLHQHMTTVSTTKWIRRRRTSRDARLHPVLKIGKVRVIQTRAQA